MKPEQSIWKSFYLTTAGTIALIPSFVLWSDVCMSRLCWHRSPRMAWRFFSRLGDGWLYAAAFLWLREMDERPLAYRVASAVLIAWGMGSALKILVRRRRQNWNPILRKWWSDSRRARTERMVQRMGSWCFPSQHSAVAVAFACAWPTPPNIALAVAVCCSRVLIGAHYLGDVLAGIAVGVLAGRLA